MTHEAERMPRDNHGEVGAKARLLLVEDNSPISNSLSQFLKLEGYWVDTAVDDSQAIQMLATAHYHLVFTEVNTSPTNGLKLLWTIRHQYPEVVVLVITAHDTIAQAVEAVKMGAFEYLTKPIIDDEIRVTIQKALQQQTLRSENYLLRQQLGLRLSLDSGNRWECRRRNFRLRKPPGMA